VQITTRIDPVSRYVFIQYQIPAGAGDLVHVRCEVRAPGGEWRPAAVWKHISDTGRRLMPDDEWDDGVLRGSLSERRAAGRRCTLVWNPFTLATGQADVTLRLIVDTGDGESPSACVDIRLENDDVVVLDDWSRVVQESLVNCEPEPGQAVWWLHRGQAGERSPANGCSLEVREKHVALPPLTYPLDLRGPHAVFVQLPPKLGQVELRLSGDERAERFGSHRPGEEVFWRWADMARQHLVIKQPHCTVDEYEDDFRAHLDRVRLVPLTPETVQGLESTWVADGERRPVIGYNEPYSWAFAEKVESNLQHREPLLAFAEARVEWVDIQIGRGGCSMVNESRVGSQLLADTLGDPVRGEVPRTSNVGRMQQFTNTLATQLRYARELGMQPVANLGATNCYPGNPLESEFSRQHPEWRDGSCLRYEVPEVRQYMLALFEEALDIGADHLSIDWCRYPNAVHSAETVTGFFRELRGLADRWGERRGSRPDIITRFPARGVTAWEHMDYATWAGEGLVDVLAPSNIQARHLSFDVAEYLEAVRGTTTRVYPCVDALHWGLTQPGMWLRRILECYDAGAHGIYIYQCDAPVLGGPESRRWVSLIGSAEALRRWQDREQDEQARYSKAIYLNEPLEGKEYGAYGRVRVWVEGVAAEGDVELLVDDVQVNACAGPPYVLTSEAREDDGVIPAGKHTLTVRARDGDGWLQQDFEITIA